MLRCVPRRRWSLGAATVPHGVMLLGNFHSQMSDDSSRKLPTFFERRNHARRTVIESRLISVDIGDSVRGVLIDVGEGGVAVQPFVPLPLGAESDIIFETPNGARVKAHGM